MEKFIKVSAKDDDAHEDVPLNDDGALSLNILRKYFPRAIGLKYFSEVDISHEIDLDDDRFYPPLGLWGDLTYYCICTENEFVNVKSEPCIEDIHCIEDDGKNNSLNMVHISISQANRTKKKSYKPKGKYKKRKPHKCDICGKNFRNQAYVETHKLMHTGEKPYACAHCDERFARQDLLRIHGKTVHDIRVRPKREPVQRSPTHKREKRRTDDIYVFAEVKKRKYTRRKSKNGEEEEEPEEEKTRSKNYQCVNCSEFFVKKASLRKHPCISNQTQFTCEECHQTFAKLNKLRLHLYKCHADQKLVKKAPLSPSAVDPLKSTITSSKSRNKCKYANADLKQEPSDMESSDEDVSYWDCLNENEHSSYIPKCDCIPDFSIVDYIEAKIPPEILTKFRFCKQNNIPWTGFLGYSALYKFWARIVIDNPTDDVEHDDDAVELQHILKEEDVSESDKLNESVTEYVIAEVDAETSEATAESTQFLSSIEDLVTFDN
ncbi:zinc finger protein 765-like [Planococcus citri]|uniref:zinc finger protein 765-like n=1 Tax=Planococcus citri TaxID=170843 RepID=UPI0031F8A96F